MENIPEIQDIKKRYEKLMLYFYNEKGKKEQLEQQRAKLLEILQKSSDNIEVLEKVKLLFQKASEFARDHSKQRIEVIVTNCLQYIFDSEIQFKIEISEGRGRTEAELYVLSAFEGSSVKTKPQEARGGGVVDIISLALRIAMLQCSNLEANGPLILDEPAKHVSDEYITQVAEFIRQASIMFERQIIMVTHNKHLSEIADKWHRIEMSDGISRVAIES